MCWVSIIYCIIDRCVSPYYLCLQQDKLYLHVRSFRKSTFNDIYGIGINKVLMNIMYCSGFVKEEKKMSILACHNNLV